MPLWPLTLPQIPLVDGYSEQPGGEVVARGEPEGGVAQTRRRHTAVAVDVEAPYLLTLEQTFILDEFHDVQCAMGAISFDHVHPRKDTAARLRFRKGLSYTKADNWWRATLSLEVLPLITAYQHVQLVRERPDRIRSLAPADTDLPEIARGLRCLTAGTVRVTAAGEPDGSFVAVPMTVGQELQVYLKRAWSTGTTGTYALLY